LACWDFLNTPNFSWESRSPVKCLGLARWLLHYNIILPPAISFYNFCQHQLRAGCDYERIPFAIAPGLHAVHHVFPNCCPADRPGGELLPQFQDRVRATVADVESGWPIS